MCCKTYTCYTDGSFKYRDKSTVYDHGIGITFNNLNMNLMLKITGNDIETNNETEEISIIYAILFQVYSLLLPTIDQNKIVSIISINADQLILVNTKLHISHRIIVKTDSLSCIRDLKSQKNIFKYTYLINQIISIYKYNNIHIKLKYVKAHSNNKFNKLADLLSKKARKLQHNDPILTKII